MFDEIQSGLDSSIRKIAHNNLVERLNRQGLSKSDMPTEKFEELLKVEIDIVKNDGKKVGAGIGIGFLVSMLF